MDESPLVLFIMFRETKRLDPGISEKEDFFLVPFPELTLALVPVDASSATCTDTMLLDGEDDRVGE